MFIYIFFFKHSHSTIKTRKNSLFSLFYSNYFSRKSMISNQISEEKLAKINEAFKNLAPKEKDDLIFVDQLENLLLEIEISASITERENILQELSIDQEGTIKRDQFIFYIVQREGSTTIQELIRDFKNKDKDYTGYLSSDDFLAVLTDNNRMSENDATEMERDAPINSKGEVDYFGFIAGIATGEIPDFK